MRIGILGVLLSFVVLVQCDDHVSLLEELKSLDFMEIMQKALADLPELDEVTQSELTGRTYDWNKCVVELGDIVDGLNRTEWWAMQCKY